MIRKEVMNFYSPRFSLLSFLFFLGAVLKDKEWENVHMSLENFSSFSQIF